MNAPGTNPHNLSIPLPDGYSIRRYGISGAWALHDESGRLCHWMTPRAEAIIEAVYTHGKEKE